MDSDSLGSYPHSIYLKCEIGANRFAFLLLKVFPKGVDPLLFLCLLPGEQSHLLWQERAIGHRNEGSLLEVR